MNSLLALVIALQAPLAPPLEQGRELTSMLYQGRDADVWSRLSDKMKQLLGKVESMAALRAQVSDGLGVEVSVVDERVETVQGLSVYVRTTRFSKAPGPGRMKKPSITPFAPSAH